MPGLIKVTVTLVNESDKDTLLEILGSWEQGGLGIGDSRYYSDGDMVYENVETPEEFSAQTTKEINNG